MAISTKTTKELGKEMEDQALQFFRSIGFRLMERNFQCRAGEIDLIFQDPKNCIVFVEVKYRSRSDFGSAQSFVNSQKQRRMAKTALFFIKKRRLQGHDFRFDVAAIGPDQIEHIPNAFLSAGYTL